MDQIIQPAKLDFPTIINNEQVYDCGRNIPGNNVTMNDDIAMSNDNVQHAIKANAKNNIDIHNDNLITISISDKQYTALIVTAANLNCISTETLNNCSQKYQNTIN